MDLNQQYFDKAQHYIPGGVNSPVRAFRGVGGTPIVFSQARGAALIDINGKSYIDLVNSWGPMILGHSHPIVVEAIENQLANGITFGAPTEVELELAQMVCDHIDSIEKLRLVSSGTEACMTALRMARGLQPGKSKVIKCIGCYHGHADPFLRKAGSGLATLGIPIVPGVPAKVLEDTLLVPYNDLEAIQQIFEKQDHVAAIILEPVAGNMGCVKPMPGYLEGLRKLCDQHQVLLIFDEVMTGFRLTWGGAQSLYQVDADLITYGKIIGGGMPVAAVGGKREYMDILAPVGDVYQAGTLSGNPIAVSAGLATLRWLRENPEVYSNLASSTRHLSTELSKLFTQAGIPHHIHQVESMMSLHFGIERMERFEDAQNQDTQLFGRYFHHLLEHGVYLPPSAFESWFISTSLADKHIDHILSVSKDFIAKL